MYFFALFCGINALTDEGKKINWKHGVKILKIIIKTLFTKKKSTVQKAPALRFLLTRASITGNYQIYC